MSAAESTVLELVGLIYDAAGDPAHWRKFLERLGQVLGTAQGTFYMEDLLNHQGSAVAVVGYDPAFARSYDEYYAAKNVYVIRGKRLLWPGNICLSQSLCPDEEAHQSEFYNDWIAPQGGGHGLMGTLLQEGSLTGTLGLVRHRGLAPFSEEDLSLLKALMPHLQRACQLHQRITSLQKERNVALDVLNRWPLGVILVNGKGRVLLANRAAETILNQRDGLIADRNGLRGNRSNETTILRGMIQGATDATRGRNGHPPGGAISLPRPSGKRPLSVLVTPACANPLLFPVNGVAAVVFVCDPETNQEASPHVLARMYGLTPTESAVALLLMQGKSIEEAA